MSTEILYINDEKFGSVSYVGTWEEWRTGMERCFREWYEDYKNTLVNKVFHQEIDEEDATAMTFEEWVEEAMDESLSEATEEEIASHDRL